MPGAASREKGLFPTRLHRSAYGGAIKAGGTDMYLPTLERAKQYGKNYRVVPVSRTLYSDIRTPVEVLRVLKGVSRHCYMLESLEDTDKWK